MQDHELRNSEPPTTWDNTMRVMLNQCPRKLYFFLRRFDYPPSIMPAYFILGRAFGEGMNLWYREEPTLPGTPEHEGRKMRAIAAAVDLWRNEGGNDKGVDSEPNLIRILQNYFEEYPREKWKYVKKGDELGWTWPLRGTRYMLGGSLDGYAEWPGYGLFFVEHKTTGGYLTDSYVTQWHYSSQVLQYSWFLYNFHGGSAEVYGGLINMATKQVKGPRSRWTTPEFARTLVKHSPLTFEQFEQSITAEIQQFERYWSDWNWPQKGFLEPANCVGGPGKSACLFRQICSSAIPIEAVEADQFGLLEKEDKWQPWLRQGET